jgi:hypothetical protein
MERELLYRRGQYSLQMESSRAPKKFQKNLRLAVESLNKPFIETPAENYLPDYIDFYKTILS